MAAPPSSIHFRPFVEGDALSVGDRVLFDGHRWKVAQVADASVIITRLAPKATIEEDVLKTQLMVLA